MQVASKPLSVPKHFLNPPGGWNPNVWIGLASVSIFALSCCGYWLWGWWSWCCFWLNVLAVHLSGSVIHDACHKAAHSNRIINAMLGHISALMLGFAFPVFTRVHLQHHAHVNDPKNDPDHFVSTGGPLLLIAPRFFYHEVFFFKRRLWKKYELLEWFLSRLFLVTVVLVSLHFGFFAFVVNYWFSPALVVGITLGLFFDYLPHRPFEERDRWKNARVYASPLLNLLIMGQNYHLVHHLWPSIPWYWYQPAYQATKPLLESKGSPLCSGLLESPKDFWGFVYDIFIGIRWHRSHPKPSTPLTAERPEQKVGSQSVL
ncbi:beta-carotene hydroxylase [Spirulina sp. CS-785/01]|uniref:beta-carotene hydroxylase n=1 Tax=Spirulina sp. CS-785/01 TaxID=3021716 RepID=UPI003FA7969E